MDSPQGEMRTTIPHFDPVLPDPRNDVRKELGSTAPKPLHNLPSQISSLAAASTIPVTNAVVQANIRRSSKTLVMVRFPARRLLTSPLW